MSPMLTALVVGWAVITVIVIAVSIIAIRGQRHGAEDEEVLIPWTEQSPLAADPGGNNDVTTASGNSQLQDSDQDIDLNSDPVSSTVGRKKRFGLLSSHKSYVDESYIDDSKPLFSDQPDQYSKKSDSQNAFTVNQLDSSFHSNSNGDSEMDGDSLSSGSEQQFLWTLKQALAPEISSFGLA